MALLAVINWRLAGLLFSGSAGDMLSQGARRRAEGWQAPRICRHAGCDAPVVVLQHVAWLVQVHRLLAARHLLQACQERVQEI